jgi:hypothetical protein
VAAEEKAGVLIGDGERIAEYPVLGRELPLEVRRPEIVGCVGGRRHHPRVVMRPPPAPARHQAPPREEIIDGASSGPVDRRMPRGEIVEELAGSPVGVFVPGRAQQVGQLRRDPVRTGVRRPAPRREARPAVLLEPVETLIAGRSADPVAGTQLGHGVEPKPVVADELQTLVHGVGLQPRHRSDSDRRVDRAV